MSPMDDVGAEMHGFRFDEATVDAFWGGKVAPHDVPAGYRELATLVQAARAPAAASELAGEASVVAAAAAAVKAPAAVWHGIHWGGSRLLAKPLSLKLAKLLTFKMAVATAAVGVGGGFAAAAATGSLPAPIQSAVSDGLSHLGISVPNPSHHAAPRPTPSATTAYLHAADVYRLCSAAGAASPAAGTNGTAAGTPSPAVNELRAAAQAQGQTVRQYCADGGASTSPATGTGTGRRSSTPSGAPTSTPAAPPSSAPAGSSSGTPPAPPSSTPASSSTPKPTGAPSGGPSGPSRGDHSGPKQDAPAGAHGDGTNAHHPGDRH
jgi:hypothetical protein